MSSSFDSGFLSLALQDLLPEDEATSSPIQPHIDTLFAEFARSRPRPITPTTPAVVRRPSTRETRRSRILPRLDLRALDFAGDYGPHLMCPICHSPFVDPVVLECDHTFCLSCYEQHRDGDDSIDRSICPSCRAKVLLPTKKASRLITNMLDDIRVCCPNTDCDQVMPRSHVEQHATRDCPEKVMDCPDPECGKVVRKKHFVPSQCIHTSHVECECGAIIELGRGDWIKHKDEACPATLVKCEGCSEKVPSKDYLSSRHKHICKTPELPPRCPGHEYGCTVEVAEDTIEEHNTSCTFARLAPFLKRQSHLLDSFQEQLANMKLRNEMLETGMERMKSLMRSYGICNSVADHLSTISHDDEDYIEEVHRQHIPSSSSPDSHSSATAHRNLVLPAHLRALTPSPTSEHNQNYNHSNDHHNNTDMNRNLRNQSFRAMRESPTLPTPAQLTALHSTISTQLSTLESSVTHLSQTLTELDARHSMTLMNETLRINEDMAHHNAALFSTRAQVQWLLNRERERVGVQMAQMQRERDVGRMGAAVGIGGGAVVGSGSDSGSGVATAVTAGGQGAGGPTVVGLERLGSPGGDAAIVSMPASGSASSSSTTPVLRSGVRRASGGSGSQERVKL